MAKSKDTDKDEAATTADPATGAVGYQPTPGQEPGPSAATLEEALRQQDAANVEASDEAAAESGEAKAAADAEAEAAIAEAGAAQEARDDEVYGRTPEDDVKAAKISEAKTTTGE